jgi:hypothetical protein
MGLIKTGIALAGSYGLIRAASKWVSLEQITLKVGVLLTRSDQSRQRLRRQEVETQ